MKQCIECMMTFREDPAPPVAVTAMCQCGVAFCHVGEGQKVKCHTQINHPQLVTVGEWTPRKQLLELAGAQ